MRRQRYGIPRKRLPCPSGDAGWSSSLPKAFLPASSTCIPSKPLDREDVIRHASETGAVVTCEEHQVIGGLGSAVCETLSESVCVPVERIGVQDSFGESGTPEELIDKYGLGVDSLCAAARRAVQRKTSR